MMFVGRENELNALQALFEKPMPSLVTCRGRRRIGKSTLIEEFARQSKSRMLQLEGIAPQKGMTNADQLKAFCRQLGEQTGSRSLKADSWFEAFRFLDEALPKSGRTVVLLDEISWMGKYDPNFAGELKFAWDRRFKRRSKLILVLCGSVSSWIADNILNNTGFVGRISLDLVLGELPLKDCTRFWGKRVERLAPGEILDVLSVTGGVPKYLEEIRPNLSADENIRRLCFTPSGTLFSDFQSIFSDVFGENATVKKQILLALAEESGSCKEIAERIGVDRGGSLSRNLAELELAGFVSCDAGFNPETGKPARQGRYRVCDNYTRFYLHYIEPNEREIKKNGFKFSSLAMLPGWDKMLGFQFENLVLSNLGTVLPKLNLGNVPVLSAAPYRSSRPSKNKGCQIDLLVQTRKSVCVVEVKHRKKIGEEVEDEVAEKIRRLPLRKGISVRTALVYLGELDPVVEGNAYFDAVIPAESMLR